MMTISRKQIGYAALLTFVVSALSWIKVSFIIGSEVGSFSLSHCLSPLIGIFGGAFGALLMFTLRTLTKFSTSNAGTSLALVCHIPTLCAALYFATFQKESNSNNITKKLFALLPLLCMILFWAHPVGSQASGYALFWLIPMLTALIPHNRIPLHALGSTFTAHAVGSVIWLYAGLVPNPVTWIALIPVVLCERLLFSCGMVLCYRTIHVLEYVTPRTKNFIQRKLTKLNV